MNYYIYQLSDPRTGEPFYIGKGKGNRIDAHEKAARRGVYSRKCAHIRDIWGSGLQVEKRILQRFADELEAYAAEKNLIEKIGLENLTNVTAGSVPQKPREVKVNDENVTLVELKRFAPTLARMVSVLDGDHRLMLGKNDITAAFDAFLARLVKDFGIQKIVEIVRPHGVILHLQVV